MSLLLSPPPSSSAHSSFLPSPLSPVSKIGLLSPIAFGLSLVLMVAVNYPIVLSLLSCEKSHICKVVGLRMLQNIIFFPKDK